MICVLVCFFFLFFFFFSTLAFVICCFFTNKEISPSHLAFVHLAMQGTMPGARRRGRPRTAWMDNIKTWTGLPVEESIRMKEDRDKCRKYVHGVANPRIEDG